MLWLCLVTRLGYARLFVLAVLVFAVGFGARLTWELSPIAGAQTTSSALNPAEARQALQGLEVAEPGSTEGYSRERFPHWSKARDFGWDVPDPSCDVRQAALIRDGENVQVETGCNVVSGTWLDPYTGNTYSRPSDMDVDHVVPLANAWRTGASSWDDNQREAYANDPDVVLSVEDNANQSKGDKGRKLGSLPTRPNIVTTRNAGYTSRTSTTLA